MGDEARLEIDELPYALPGKAAPFQLLAYLAQAQKRHRDPVLPDDGAAVLDDVGFVLVRVMEHVGADEFGECGFEILFGGRRFLAVEIPLELAARRELSETTECRLSRAAGDVDDF